MMQKLFRCRIWIFTILVAVTSSAMAAATGGDVLMDYLMRSAIFTPNELSISLTQEFRYNDNIDESHYQGRAIDSFINDTMLNLKWTRTLRQMTYGLEASATYEHYFHKRKNDDSTDFSYSLSPVLIGEIVDFGLGGKLMLSAHSSYVREEVDASKNKTTNTLRHNMDMAWDCPVTGKISLVMTGKLDAERYRDKSFKSLENNKYGVSLSPTYRYSQRTRFGLTSGITQKEYLKHTEHDDYKDLKLGAFAEHIFSERTALWMETGATRFYYEKDSISDKSRCANDWEWYFRGQLMYQMLKNLSVGLTFSRDIDDSYSTGARGKRFMDDLGGTVTWDVTGKIKLFQKISFSRRNELLNDEDNDRFEYDLLLQYQSERGVTAYAGWNLVDKHYKFQGKKSYLENEWRAGLKLTF